MSPLQFSVIIPTRNRPVALGACLQAIAALDYPRDRFEVLVVDDGSAHALDAVTNPFRAQLDLSLLRQSPSGPAAARNLGIARARGEYLAFTDDDCRPATDWLRRLESRLADRPHTLFGGRTINGLEENPYAATCHLILDSVCAYYDPAQGRAHFYPSSNMAVAAAELREAGGFSLHWPRAAAEDRELCRRWLNGGREIAYAPEAVVRHYHDLNFASFCRLHFTYGQGAYDYHEGRGRIGQPAALKPDWKFHAGCFRRALAQKPRTRALRMAFLLGVWQTANTLGYLAERFTAGSGRG